MITYEVKQIMTELHDTDWDSRLIEGVSFYQKCKEMRPFMGKNYGQLKTLFVCQSYGVKNVKDEPGNPSLEQINETPEKWYGQGESAINEFLKNAKCSDWVDTRCLLGKLRSFVWYKAADAIIESDLWGNISEKVFQDPTYQIYARADTDQPARAYVYSHFALMNYFTRPVTGIDNSDERNLDEKHKETFTLTECDSRESYKTFTQLVKVINPKIIVFLGKEAHKAFKKELSIKSDTAYDNIEIAATNSPKSAWRNWWAEDGGKREFLRVIKKHHIIPGN